jgi:diaminobutyrate-2-oxoglutarate transaminase
VTGRRTVVAFTNAFHGMTAGALAVSGRGRQRGSAGIPSGDVVRLPYDGYGGAGTEELERFETMVGDPSGGVEAPAAFIVETVQGEGGLTMARAEWLRHLAAMASRLGSLLLVDEVQTGCGRTGAFFSFEQSGIVPDIVCLAKSIGGIGLPLALALIRPDFDQWSPGEHNGTFRGNNLAFVAGTAALNLWGESEFLAGVESSMACIRGWIDGMVAELGANEVAPRGRGMMTGLAFADPSAARRIAAEAFRRNLLIETTGPQGEVLKLFPPLTIEADVLAEGLRRLGGAIAAVVQPAVPAKA